MIATSDAAAYYESIVQLIHGVKLHGGSAWKPIAMTTNAILLKLVFQNVVAFHVLNTSLVALSFYVAGKYIARKTMLGIGVAYVVFCAVYLIPVIGSFGTELLGIAVGQLALVALLEGVWGERKYFTLGLLLLSVGMNVRPGAMFIIPALLVFSFWFLAEKKINRFLLSNVVAVVLGFVISIVVSMMVSASQEDYQGNFSRNLYALSIGKDAKSWRQANQDLKQGMQQLKTVNQRNDYIYKVAWDNIKSNPMQPLKGFMGTYFKGDLKNYLVFSNNNILMYGLGVTLLLLIFYLFNSSTAETSFFSRKMIWFLLFSLAGILFSMPFLPTFGRNLAVSVGFNALMILLGLYGALNFILQKIQKDKSLMNVNISKWRQGFSTTFMFALLFGIVVSPFLLLILPKSASQKVNLIPNICTK
ncbi:MAG: hypothetical protein IPL35_11000 [Sphingobacteriales bacterium]|nr:hypothetical protein [Sphingobacteriales bacterium]